VIAAVIGPFAEALRATFQPCTFLLIVPTLTAVVAARAGWRALAAATIAAVLGGWILMDNRWILDGGSLRFSAVLVVALLVLVTVPAGRGRMRALDRVFRRESGRAATAGAITLIASLWWRPCVGEELGAILNGAQNGLGGQLVPMTAYMLGAMLPVALVVATRYAADPSERVLSAATWIAASVLVVVAASLVAGQHDEVVVTLTRWTVE
jgi:cytochrome c biogenesis protein CcdA